MTAQTAMGFSTIIVIFFLRVESWIIRSEIKSSTQKIVEAVERFKKTTQTDEEDY
jgi:SNF family Na+-dependent transporter